MSPKPFSPTSNKDRSAQSQADLIASALARFRVVFRSRYDEGHGPLASLLPRQKLSRLDKGPSTKLWTVPVEFRAPIEDDARQAVKFAVESLRQTERETTTVDTLQASNVHAEWVSNKRNKSEKVEGSKADIFERLSRDVEDDMVTIYLHGGAYIWNGPGSSRGPAARLSAASNSRVLVLDYRLSPQAPFPSPILDLLVTYLTLLYPPPGSLHKPIPASRIVFAGESCGANICLGTIQVLRYLGAHHKQSVNTSSEFRFNGMPRRVPMPAGLAMLSIAADYTYASFPSWAANAPFDIWTGHPPYVKQDFPTDSIWPSKPPRADPYCTRLDLVHPLVSPCLARSWEGSCPMWIAEGEEQMLDGVKLMAKTALQDGVRVEWEQYERMPHSWPLLLPMFPQSALLWQRWGNAVRGFSDENDARRSEGVVIEVEDMKIRDMDLATLTNLTNEEARVLIWDKAKTREDYVGTQNGQTKL